MIESLDSEVDRVVVTRQSSIKVWLPARLESAAVSHAANH
jgi:hypothetical protein